jgi:Tfp pilus assembly protein PilF
LERALQIGEQALGPDHPDIAIRCANLGLVLRALGDLAGARTEFQRALQIGEQALGPNHPNIAIWCGNLGRVLKALGI